MFNLKKNTKQEKKTKNLEKNLMILCMVSGKTFSFILKISFLLCKIKHYRAET